MIILLIRAGVIWWSPLLNVSVDTVRQYTWWLIGIFWVVFCLCVKMSLSAKPFIWKWLSAYRLTFMQIKLIFIWKVLHEDSIWNNFNSDMAYCNLCLDFKVCAVMHIQWNLNRVNPHHWPLNTGCPLKTGSGTCMLFKDSYYCTLNSLTLFWLAKIIQWIFEMSAVTS